MINNVLAEEGCKREMIGFSCGKAIESLAVLSGVVVFGVLACAVRDHEARSNVRSDNQRACCEYHRRPWSGNIRYLRTRAYGQLRQPSGSNRER